jgi:hypothetical protein
MSAPRVILARKKEVLLANTVACWDTYMIQELCISPRSSKYNDYETRLGTGLLWANSLER